jgi:S1-C subfamily serine protease
VGVDDKPIKSNNDLYLVLEKYAPGDKVEISYLRNEKREKASVLLTE